MIAGTIIASSTVADGIQAMAAASSWLSRVSAFLHWDSGGWRWGCGRDSRGRVLRSFWTWEWRRERKRDW